MENEYQEELERLEHRYGGVHEKMLCDRCKREFRVTVEEGFEKPKEWVCPICLEDSSI